MVICINAGHDINLDPGACGSFSTEAEVVRKVGLIACSRLEAMGYTTVFVQEDELDDVCSIANHSGAEVFVSIHCNAAPTGGKAHGTETFYYEYGDPSYHLAGRVQDRLLNTLGTTDRGLKDGSGLWVIRGTDMAATILTEIGFIDNLEEEQLINENIQEIGNAIAEGIRDYVSMDY